MAALSTQNPWPGLRAFTETDHEFFFGRERETAELLDLVQRSTVVVLYGQSGLGKTSLLQAGLFPDLKRLDFLPLRVRFDHSDEAPPLAQQVKNELSAYLDRLQISCPRPGQDETLWEYFHRRDVDFWGPRNRLLTPVIVFDQFEEVFTLGQRSEQSAARVAQFALELEAVLEHRPPVAVRERLEASPDEALHYDLHREAVKFIVSLREDFLADLDPWRARMPSLLPNRFRLERMTGAQALDVVQRGGRELVDAEVAHGIVDFVSKSQRAHAVRSMEQRDVEPALLSVVCDELNRRRVDAGKPHITADFLSHEREEIIQSFYDRAFDDIDPRVRDWVEDRLLTASGYRNRAALEDAVKEGLPAAAFDQLVNRRILHREERSGVVWLELTHDLLSDPAARSRTAREQRRLAEEARRQKEKAAAREAQLRLQLKKSRTRTTIYGFLLLGTAAALAFATLSWRRAEESKRRAEEAQRQAEEAHRTAEGAEQSRRQSYQTAAEMTESLSLGIGSANWVPAAAVLHNIEDTKKAYDRLSPQSSGEQLQRLNLEHARFLTKAADSLFEIGHVEDGLQDAKAALDILDHATGTQATGDAARLLLAEARYEKGNGLLATGQLSAAKTTLKDALTLAKDIPNSELKLDFARVHVLAELGLGEVELQRLQFSDADARFRAALDFATRYGSDEEEVLSWQVLALQGRGRSQWNDEEAGKNYDQAADILVTSASSGKRKSLTERNPGNPRWKMMAANLTYWQGSSLRRLGQSDKAIQCFKNSEAEAKELCSRDCRSALDPQVLSTSSKKDDDENWQWRLLLLQAWDGLGLTYSQRSEWDSAETVLHQADRIAEELAETQPTWRRAGFLHVLAEVSLGESEAGRYRQSSQPPDSRVFSLSPGNAEKDPRLYGQADSHFQKAQNIVAANGYSASDGRDFVRMVYLALTDQGSLRAAKANACGRGVTELCLSGNGEKKIAKEQMQAAAEQFDKDALDKYRDAFRHLEPIAEMAKESAEIGSDQAWLYSLQGTALNDSKRYDEAVEAYRREIDARVRLTRLEETAKTLEELASAHFALGEIYQAKNSPEDVLQFESAKDAIDKALKLDPKDNRARFLGTKGVIYDRLAAISLRKGDLKDAVEKVGTSIVAEWAGLNIDFADPWLNGNINFALTGEKGATLKTIEKAIRASASGPARGSLTPEQKETLLKQIESLRRDHDPNSLLDHFGQTAGTLRPMLPGIWSNLAGSDLKKAREHILAAAPTLTSSQIHGIRELPLDFYEDADLYEADAELADGTKGVVECVRRGAESILLTGSIEDLRKLNRTPPKLDKPSRAIDYLRFAFGQMHTVESGRVQWIDRVGDLDWLPSASPAHRSKVASKIKPLILEQRLSYNGEWQAIGSVAFGGRMEVLSFRLSHDGNVSLGQEKYADNNLLPIFLDTFSNGIRIRTTVKALEERELAQALQKLKADPDYETREQVPALYAELKRWKEAAEAQRDMMAHLQRVPGKDEDNALILSDLIDLYKYELLSRNFAGALAASDAIKEKKVDPSGLWVDFTRAGSLLFLGRTQEAEEIYLRNVGKEFQNHDWSEEIVDGSKRAEVEGLPHPDFEHIRNLMYQERLNRTQQGLKANPNDPSLLQRLPSDYFNLKRWNEAVEAEKNWMALVQREFHSDAERNQALADANVSLSWYQLFARNFAGALAAAEAGRKLDESNLALDTNRAHALLFLGRTQDAEAIYLGNRGKKLDPQQNETWDEAILKDFDDFEAEGLTNPEIPRIRKLLLPEQE